MADLDLYKQAYRDYLGREASDDEANNWASGAYGGGSVQDRINQIANSGEAQARLVGQNQNVSHPQEQPTGGTLPGTTTSPWLANAPSNPFGTPESGTGPGGVENPAYHGAGSADWNNFSSQLGGAYQQYLGRSASPDELNQWWTGGYGYGSGLSGVQSMIGAIRNSGEAQSRPQGTGGGGVGTTTTTTNTTSGMPGGGDMQAWVRSLLSGNSSPQALAALEPQLNQRGIRLQKDSDGNIRGRLYLPDGSTVDVTNGWGQPWTWIDRGKGGGSGGSGGGGPQGPANQYSDPYSQFLEQLLKSRIGNLGPVNDPNRAAYEQALQQRANALGQGNQQLDQLLGYLQQRYTDLQGSGYTGAEQEVLRTGALDPIERDRTAAKQRLAERLAAMGHTQQSGVFQEAMQHLDQEFDGLRGIQQTQLSTNELARRENRNQRAEAIAGQIADIPEQRSREQLDVFSALEHLSQVARSEDDARAREAISYGGVLSDLGPQRLQLAMQAAGMGGNPAALGGVLSNIAGMNQQSQAYNAQNSNWLSSAMGTLAAIIQRSGQSGASGFGY